MYLSDSPDEVHDAFMELSSQASELKKKNDSLKVKALMKELAKSATSL